MFKQYLSLSRTVHLLSLGALVNRAGAFLVPFLTLYLRESLDLGVGFASIALGVFGVGALVASLVGGHLADRIGRKTVMLLSLFGGAIILLFFGYLTTPWTILAAIFIFSLFSEMYRPAAFAMVADVTDPAQRTHAFGLMYVAVNLGFAVAAAIGGILAEFSFLWLFWGDAITTGLFGLLILLWIKETLPAVGSVEASEQEIRRTDVSSQSESTLDVATITDHTLANANDASFAAAVRHIMKDGVFLVFCGATFVLAVMYTQSICTLPLCLTERGYSARTYGWVIAINGALIVLMQLPVTSIVARYHRGWMIALSAVITGAGFALFGFASLPWHFSAGVVVWTCGEMMGSPLSSAIVSDLAPKRFRARYMGVFTMSFSSSMMIGAPLGGLVLNTLGSGYLWGICGLLGLVSGLAYFVLRQRLLPSA